MATTFTNSGATLSPSGATTGTLNVTGNYVQASGGTLKAQIKSAVIADVDKLKVTGSATLTGTLAVDSTAFTAAVLPVGTRLNVLQAASVSGTFSTVTGLPTASNGTWTVQYTATRADLVLQ